MPQGRLQVTDSLGTRTVAIAADPFTIGRRATNHLSLTGSDVSRDHAVIERLGPRFILRDRGSLCGTFVNGEPIDERLLEDGDRIHVGRNNGADLLFHADHASPSVASAQRPGGDLQKIAALLEGLRALGSGGVLDEVLALVLDSAIRAGSAERGFIMLADANDHLAFTLGRGSKRTSLPGGSFRTSRKIPEQVYATGHTQVVADLLDADVAGGHAGTIALGIRQVLCVPLKLVRYVDSPLTTDQTTRIGVLYLDGQDKGVLLSPETRMALEALAEEAALAIESARLYRESLERVRLEQQMKIGADIQQALLPDPHSVRAGLDVACSSMPCLALGGDFVDYVHRPDGQFDFVLGDVSGKGLPAALLTGVLQGIFSVEAALARSPAEAVTRANDVFIRKDVHPRYATLFHGTLSAQGRLTYTNAGHCAPVLLTASSIERLARGGTIVGAFPDAHFEEDSVMLAAGDLLVVFSDGITEAFNSLWEPFGEERLVECLRANGHLAPEALIDRVMAEVRAFEAGALQSDDQTMLVVRYAGSRP